VVEAQSLRDRINRAKGYAVAGTGIPARDPLARPLEGEIKIGDELIWIKHFPPKAPEEWQWGVEIRITRVDSEGKYWHLYLPNHTGQEGGGNSEYMVRTMCVRRTPQALEALSKLPGFSIERR